MSVTAIVCIVAAIISFRYVSFGICFLLLTKCIISIPTDYVAVHLGVGILLGPDIVMTAILARILMGLSTREISLGETLPLILLICFILLSSVYAYLFEHGKLDVLRRTTFGIAIYYAIPLSFFLFDEEEKTFVIDFALAVAIVGIGVQEYLIHTKNVKMLIAFNPYFQDLDHVETLMYSLNKGAMPRVLPAGLILIAMSSGYSLVKALTSSSLKRTMWYAVLYVTSTLFLLSTGTRHFIAVSALVLVYALYRAIKLVGLAKRLFLVPAISVGVVLLTVFVLHSSLFGTLVKRSVDLQKHGYYDAGLHGRYQQSWNAVQLIFQYPFGIGAIRPTHLGRTERAGMWDVHGVLIVGFLGGIPAIICLFWFLIRLYKKYKFGSDAPHALACSAALLYAITLTMLNFTSAFSSGESLLGFGVFAGYVLTADRSTQFKGPDGNK